MASFGKAFSAARKAGKKEFTWQGKRFHTRQAGETPSRGPTPSAAPRASSGSLTSSRAIPVPTARPSGAPTPTSRPSRSPRNTMKSGRAIAGPSGEAKLSGSPKIVPPRKSFGGSALGGFIKWGSAASPKVRAPYPHTRRKPR